MTQIHCSKIVMSREVFDALPPSADGVPRNALSKALMNGIWYAVEPQGILQLIEVLAYASEE